MTATREADPEQRCVLTNTEWILHDVAQVTEALKWSRLVGTGGICRAVGWGSTFINVCRRMGLIQNGGCWEWMQHPWIYSSISSYNYLYTEYVSNHISTPRGLPVCVPEQWYRMHTIFMGCYFCKFCESVKVREIKIAKILTISQGNMHVGKALNG